MIEDISLGSVSSPTFFVGSDDWQPITVSDGDTIVYASAAIGNGSTGLSLDGEYGTDWYILTGSYPTNYPLGALRVVHGSACNNVALGGNGGLFEGVAVWAIYSGVVTVLYGRASGGDPTSGIAPSVNYDTAPDGRALVIRALTAAGDDGATPVVAWDRATELVTGVQPSGGGYTYVGVANLAARWHSGPPSNQDNFSMTGTTDPGHAWSSATFVLTNPTLPDQPVSPTNYSAVGAGRLPI